MLFRSEFDVIGLIGVILLIGIVKKNAILMIDFAIERKTVAPLSSYDAIYEACLLRFRPIMMTSYGRNPRRGTAGAELRPRRRTSPPPGALRSSAASWSASC